MTRTALITGAGIAGEVAAWWLARFGWSCTVVERSPGLRTQGQNIDVRGAAREVLRRMPSGGDPGRTMDDEVGDRSTGEVGTRFVDADDGVLAEFPAGTSDTGGATAEREILRGQLAELLYDRTRDEVDHRFGVTVDRVEEEPDGVAVTFSDGSTDRFDVLVAAEGVGSTTRRRVFGDLAERRPLGLTMGYYSIDRAPEDDDWWNWYNAPGGRSVTTRPDNVGRTRVTLSFRSDDQHDEGPVQEQNDEQKQLLREKFADAGWRTDRLLAGLAAADDLYLEDLGQILCPTWSSGRVVLLGDAAWCATPVSGMGTSLAIVGGYVLAGELAAHVHHRDAFAGYERILRPYVEQAQKLPPGTPQVVHPRSAVGLGVLRTALKVAGSAPVKAVSEKLISPPADNFELPDYEHLIPVADGNRG